MLLTNERPADAYPWPDPPGPDLPWPDIQVPDRALNHDELVAIRAGMQLYGENVLLYVRLADAVNPQGWLRVCRRALELCPPRGHTA